VLAGDAVIGEVVADRLPGGTSVVGTLDDLTEPSAGLGGVDAVGVQRGPLDVVDLPAREVRTADLPVLAVAVRRQDERTLSRASQNPYPSHPELPSEMLAPTL
jgi:hypothetical protein